MRSRLATLPLAVLLACGDGGGRDAPTLEHTPLPAQDLPLSGGLLAETHPETAPDWRFDLSHTSMQWKIRFDDADEGVAGQWFALQSFDDWDDIAVPGAWDLVHAEGFNRQTAAWYALTFATQELGPRSRVKFEGVFREARVWLNGIELGEFDLPYLPFAFDVTDIVKAGQDNTLVVRIDNRLDKSTLPCDTDFHPGKHGWFPYGGITRPVVLDGSGEWAVAQARVRGTASGELSAEVWLHGASGTATVQAAVSEPGGAPLMASAPIGVDAAHPGIRLQGTLAGVKRWSPQTADSRYELALDVTSAGVTTRQVYYFGFRDFEARDGTFFLNGEERFLHGINRHEDDPLRGPVFDKDFLARDIALMAELGVDFIRPGHYPNDVRGIFWLDRAGLLIAEEVPVYQLSEQQMADPVLVDRAVRALQRMIIRDFNRPGIVMWSIANENHCWAKTAAAFNQAMKDAAQALDPDRPIMVVAVTIPPFSEWDDSSGVADVIGVNEYFGWYMGQCQDAGVYLDKIQALFPERTFLVSEYGAGCLQGRHLDGQPDEESEADHSYSEEFQAYFHEQHLQQFTAREYIRGIMPWAFADFRMQWTPTTGDPHPVELMNLKGLVSYQRVKKAAFGVVAAAFPE